MDDSEGSPTQAEGLGKSSIAQLREEVFALASRVTALDETVSKQQSQLIRQDSEIARLEAWNQSYDDNHPVSGNADNGFFF